MAQFSGKGIYGLRKSRPPQAEQRLDARKEQKPQGKLSVAESQEPATHSSGANARWELHGTARSLPKETL